jgi:hypothetical protein
VPLLSGTHRARRDWAEKFALLCELSEVDARFDRTLARWRLLECIASLGFRDSVEHPFEERPR